MLREHPIIMNTYSKDSCPPSLERSPTGSFGQPTLAKIWHAILAITIQYPNQTYYFQKKWGEIFGGVGLKLIAIMWDNADQ